MMDIVLIAAVAENGVIGRGGVMPWRLRSDMRHFRALTSGRPVVMGRKTYLSLAIKPLPTMRLNPDVKDLFAFRYEDFVLEGYEAHPHIKAEVAV